MESGILFRLCNVLVIIFKLPNFVESSLVPQFQESEGNCSIVLQEFAYHTSQFTLCSILHARPIKLCESCVKNFTNLQTSFEKIMKESDDDGKLCKTKLIHVDRLAIIETEYKFVNKLWQDGNCASCFEVVNGSRTDNLSNETKEYFNRHSVVYKCMSQHFINGSYNSSVCQDCFKMYYNMNDFYENLKLIHAESLCIDIVDSVNATRAEWNNILHCDRKRGRLEIGLVAALLFAALFPILFYVSAKQFTKRTETQVFQQKRLVQTFIASSSSMDRS